MYMTHQERLEAARKAWEMSQDQQAKLRLRMNRLSRKKASTSYADYLLLWEETELVRCQYAAVALNTDRLWAAFERLSEQTADA